MLDKSSALSDVKILDFSHLLAGPFATQILGDYGAEVYKLNAFTLVMILDDGTFLIRKLEVIHLLVTWLGIEIKDR